MFFCLTQKLSDNFFKLYVRALFLCTHRYVEVAFELQFITLAHSFSLASDKRGNLRHKYLKQLPSLGVVEVVKEPIWLMYYVKYLGVKLFLTGHLFGPLLFLTNEHDDNKYKSQHYIQ